MGIHNAYSHKLWSLPPHTPLLVSYAKNMNSQPLQLLSSIFLSILSSILSNILSSILSSIFSHILSSIFSRISYRSLPPISSSQTSSHGHTTPFHSITIRSLTFQDPVFDTDLHHHLFDNDIQNGGAKSCVHHSPTVRCSEHHFL